MLPLWHRRVSRYIDSIILNGLIKCILNNTKLEKKKGATNCIYSVLGKCCYSFNFICDIIIIFPPFHARHRVREPSVNTTDGSEVAETSFGGGWEGAGVNRSLVGLGASSPWVWRIAAGGLFWSWQRGFVWKMSYSLSVLVQVPVLLRSQTQVMDDLRCQTLSCQGADGGGSPGAFSSASAVGLCSCCPTSPPLAVR